MIPGRRRCLTILAGGLAGGLAGSLAGRARAAAWQGQVFGAEARIATEDGQGLPAPLLARLQRLLDRQEQLFSLYRADSCLLRLNATGRLDPAPAEFTTLLGLAGALHRATGGLFDPTVQPLWRALALGTDEAPARAAIGWHRLHLAQASVRLAPGQGLTLNGIAQGWAADRVAALLRAEGYRRTLVDMGEIATLGGPFRLGIDTPAGDLPGRITLKNSALATSAPGALMLGPAQGHILGPAGEPARWQSISVEARSAAIADAASTALCLLPASEFPRVLPQIPGLRQVIAIDEAGDLRSFTA